MKTKFQFLSIISFGLLAATALIAPRQASAQPNYSFQNWCQIGGQQVMLAGLPSTTVVQQSFPGCTVSAYLSGTLTLAPIFSDKVGTAKANPFTANSDASFVFYAAPSVALDITISGAGMPAPRTFPDVVVSSSGGGGALFPSSFPKIVVNTSTTTARNGIFSDVVSLFGSGSCVGFLKNDGTCAAGSSGAVINATPQNTLLIQPNAGSVANLAGPSTTAVNSVAGILNGVKDAAQFQTTPTSNDGLANILATPNSYANAGPAYPSVEAPVETGPFWRVPLLFFNAEFLWSVAPPYAVNTFFNDQRFGTNGFGNGNSSLGYYAYNPAGNFSGGVPIPVIYDRITHDQESVQPGHGQSWISHWHDTSFTGSGINESGVWDSKTGEWFNFISTRRGINNPIIIQAQANGDGDHHTVSNDTLCAGGDSTANDEGCTNYRNQNIENQVVWTATSPSTQAPGTTHILGNYVDSSGLAGDGFPLVDSTQASAKCLVTAIAQSPVFTVAGSITSTCTYTPDNIGHLTADITNPPQYNGGTTTATVVVNGLSSPLTVGEACWADSRRIESAQITSVLGLSGGSQTVTVKLRYSHQAQAYVVQGPNNCKYIEAMANRKLNGSNAPIRDWARVIGASDAHTLLFSAIGVGGYEPWPQGSFSTQALGPMTITRDGAGHASAVIPGFIGNQFNNAFIKITTAIDPSYDITSRVVQSGTPPTSIFTWVDSGPAGSTTATGSTPILTNFTNYFSTQGIESNAYIMMPGAEVVYTGNVTTHVMDGSNLVEYNAMTVASGDTLEVQHGNEIISNLEHNSMTTWTPSSSSMNSGFREEALAGVVRPGFVWDRIQVGLERGEGQFWSAGGTQYPSATYLQIFGDRMWNTFISTPAPSAGIGPGSLWTVSTCPLTGCTVQADPYYLIHIGTPHSESAITYSEWNQTLGMRVGNTNFMDMNQAGVSFRANDGSNNYSFNFSTGALGLALGTSLGPSTASVIYTIASGTTTYSDGTNTSHFTQTPAAFSMDKPINVPSCVGCGGSLTGSVTTTGALTDVVTITGMTSSGHCGMSPTNAVAGTMIQNATPVFIDTFTTNAVTIHHVATSGASFSFVCTAN